MTRWRLQNRQKSNGDWRERPEMAAFGRLAAITEGRSPSPAPATCSRSLIQEARTYGFGVSTISVAIQSCSAGPNKLRMPAVSVFRAIA